MTPVIRSRARDYTPGPWKVEGLRGGVGSLTRGKVIKAELPCINGLRAWFTIAYVYERDDEERLITEGVIGEAGVDARLLAAAPDLAGASTELDRLALVIESAVRNTDPIHHEAILALIRDNRVALSKSRGEP